MTIKHKHQVLALIESGHTTLDEIEYEIKKVQPDIRRDTVRGRLGDLKREGVIRIKGINYSIV